MSRSGLFTFLGALSAFIAVGAGAFGAHALKSHISPEHLAAFETGARYQMYHALALFITAYLEARGWSMAKYAGWFFVAGIVLFSGSLYLLALTGVARFGMITPLGGAAFLAGWLALVICAWAGTAGSSEPHTLSSDQ